MKRIKVNLELILVSLSAAFFLFSPFSLIISYFGEIKTLWTILSYANVCGLGVWSFYRFIIALKVKRIIEDIPTAKIKTSAVGSFVELNGVATRNFHAKGWLEGTLFFGEAVTGEFLILRDRSGKLCLVFPEGAYVDVSIINSEQYKYILGDPVFAPVLSVMRFNRGLNLGGNVHLEASWGVFNGGPLYVMGYAESKFSLFSDPNNPRLIDFVSFMTQELDDGFKKSKTPLQPKTSSADLQIRAPGMLWLNSYIDQKTSLERSRKKLKQIISQISLVVQADANQPMLISNESESKLVRKVNFRAGLLLTFSLFIIIGGTLIIYLLTLV